ncbi:class I SAM-dependent methyltransferase [Bacillus bombysepticus]
MALKSQSITMEAVCAIRSEYSKQLDDNYSNRLLEHLPNAVEGRETLDTGSRGMFSRSVILRSLYFRNLLKEQSENFDQLVILSAGLDLSVLDIEEWKNKKVFSVDHPYSQEFCREIFNKSGIDQSIYRYIPYDLTQDLSQLIELLEQKGMDRTIPTLILWEGATYYFNPENIYQVLETFATSLPNVMFVCDCLNKDAYLKHGKPSTIYVEKNFEFLEKIGEPWKGFFVPSEFDFKLKEIGYEEIKIIPRENIEEQLMGEVKMGLQKMFFVEAKKGASQIG